MGKGQSDLPLGHQFALRLIEDGPQAAREVAVSENADGVFDAFMRVQGEEPELAFLHSALCAMSLPAKRPKDETKPIIREDGKYALAINPKPVLQVVDGKSVMRSLGVPFGSYPRVVLIYMLSEAVKNKSRDIYLGRNFTEWMRKLGYQTISYGPRGSARLLKEQVDRLLACEWQIRWDQDSERESAFAVKEVKLSNEYAGINRNGEFAREIRLSEVFYNHLVDHAVPLNEVAIRELKEKPTALDLYTYLAYRLTRITTSQQVISWDQLARHLGNESGGRRFRQTIRETMNLVSAVYPNANVDLSGKVVKLYPSPAPMERKFVGPHLGLSSPRPIFGLIEGGAPRSSAKRGEGASRRGALKLAKITDGQGALEPLGFPDGSLRFGKREAKFLEIAREHGGGWDIDLIASAYREAYGAKVADKPEGDVLKSWEGFVKAYVGKRGSLL